MISKSQFSDLIRHISHKVPGQEQNVLKASNSAISKINLIH